MALKEQHEIGKHLKRLEYLAFFDEDLLLNNFASILRRRVSLRLKAQNFSEGDFEFLETLQQKAQ